MKGSLRKVRPGVYDLLVNLKDPNTGKWRQKSRRFHGGERKAETALAAFVAELTDDGYIEPSKGSLGAYLDQWLAGAKSTVTPRTWSGYERWLRNHIIPHLGVVPLAKLSPAHLRAAYAKMRESGRLDGKGGLSAQSVLHAHRVLKEALTQAVEDGDIAANPAAKVKPPKPDGREMSVLDEAQTLALLEAARETPIFIPVVIAATTGLRLGEVLALRWQDIDLDAGTLTVAQAIEYAPGIFRFKSPKTKRSRRTIKLSVATASELRKWRATQFDHRQAMGEQYYDHGLVVCRRDGKPLTPHGFSARFSELIKRSGLPKVRFHDLRHGHASHLLDQGAQVTEVSSRLGHSTPGMTLNVYAHRMPGSEDRMIERYDEALGWQTADEG